MNNISLSSGNFDLERYTSPSKLIVTGRTTLNAINMCSDLILDIEVKENAEFTLNLFDFDDRIKHNIKIKSASNSKVNLNISFIAIKEYDLSIDAIVDGDNINNDVYIRGINESSNVNIVLNGTALKKCKDSVINEYAKVINTSDLATTLIPNLVVDTSLVTANHGISIGSIDDEVLFYIMSKGISRINAIKLIEEGFILSIMSDEIKDRIRNILLGR